MSIAGTGFYGSAPLASRAHGERAVIVECLFTAILIFNDVGTITINECVLGQFIYSSFIKGVDATKA